MPIYINPNNSSIPNSLESNNNLIGYVTPLRGQKLWEATIEKVYDDPYKLDVSFPDLDNENTQSISNYIDTYIYVYHNGHYQGKLVYATSTSHPTISNQRVLYTYERGNTQFPLSVEDTLVCYAEYGIHPRIPTELNLNPSIRSWATDKAPPLTIDLPEAIIYHTQDNRTSTPIDLSYTVTNRLGISYSNLSISWSLQDIETTLSTSNVLEGNNVSYSNATNTLTWQGTTTTINLPVGVYYICVVVSYTNTTFSSTVVERYFVPVIIHNDSFRPIEVVAGLTSNVSTGYDLTFDVIDNPDDLFIDNSMSMPVAFWGYNYNDNIEATQHELNQLDKDYGIDETLYFLGFTQIKSIQVNANFGVTAFNAIGVGTKLSNIAGFGNVFISGGIPSSFSDPDYPNPTVATVASIILYYYTTALNICRFDIIDINDLPFERFYVDSSTPLEQMVELLDAIDCVISFDATGKINFHPNLDFIPLNNRANHPITAELEDRHIIDITVEFNYDKPVYKVETRGIVTGYNLPVFAEYPGNGALGEGTVDTVTDKFIATSENELAERAGRRGAKIDNLYVDSSNNVYRTPSVNLTLVGAWATYFFTYRGYVIINYTYDNEDLSNYLFIIDSISIDYVDGTSRVSLTLHAASNGNSATITTKEPIPLSSLNFSEGLDDSTIVSQNGFNLNTIGVGSLESSSAISRYNTINGAITKVALFTDDKKAYVTDNYGSSDIEWSQRNLSISGDVLYFTPYSRNVNKGLLLTTTNLYEASVNLASGSITTTNLVTFPVTSTHVNVSVSSVDNDVATCTLYDPATQDFYQWLTTNGITWTQVNNLNRADSSGVVNHRPGICFTHINTENVYIGVMGGGPTYPNGQVFRSVDSGVTFSLDNNYSVAGQLSGNSTITHMELVYDELEDTTMYQSVSNSFGNTFRFYKVENDGTYTRLYAKYKGDNYNLTYLIRPFTISYIIPDRIIAHSIKVSGKRVTLSSADGGITWRPISNEVLPDTLGDYTGSIITGQYGTELFLFGAKGSFAYSSNYGYSITDKGKELRAKFPSISNIVGFTGDE